MTDLTGPFLKELAHAEHHFFWQLDRKTGRIFGVHREYDRSFTPLEVVAWSETGQRYDDEYAAAQVVGLQTITDQVKHASDRANGTALRAAILKTVGLEGCK